MTTKKVRNLAAAALLLQLALPALVFADDLPEKTLQGGVQMTQAETDAYRAASTKLHSSVKMDSDDFRALQIGVTGLELVRSTGDKASTVEQVFKGLPAAAAGIKVGEQVADGAPGMSWLEQNSAQLGGRPIWAFTGGKAGSTVTLQMIRHGQLVPITITRMNIEDIPDAKMRKMYEKMARKLGSSGEGTAEVPEPGHHMPMLLRALGI